MQTIIARFRAPIAGAIAMLAALVAYRFFAPMSGARPIVSSLADGVLLLLPVSWFDRIKTALGDQSKTWLFIGISLAFLAIGAALGWWIGRDQTHWRARSYQAASLLFSLSVLAVFLTDEAQLRDAFIATVITLLAGAFAFGLVMTWLNEEPTTSIDGPSRRAFVGVVATVIGAIVLGRDVRQIWQMQATATPESVPETAAITPNDGFYTISKNFVDPTNNRDVNWSINVSGEVDHAGGWSYEQFQAMGTEHTITTMLCISNPVGGNLIGTAEWTGVPLATVLDEIGAAGAFVIFLGDDGYETSVPIDRCRHPQAWLVWGMNGEPLPEKHGAPVRAIIPGLYGMKSVKWLTGIHLSATDRLGFWESRQWTNTAVVKPMSRIDFPRITSTLDTGTISVRGIAFGGDLGVSGVELSTDGGSSWQPARITEQPNPDGVAWSLWQYDWVADPGTHTLVARMLTADGEPQTSDDASPLPDGSSGWHTVTVYVNRT